MPPAARTFDQTAHGTPLTGAGSPDVFIGKMPAWRMTDVHTCPLITGPGVAHVGGIVQAGSTSVFINGIPAVRQGDVIVEAGPPNSIVAGCPTVNIG